MIALLLGLLVIAAVSGIFLSSSRNYREDERIARMHDNARFAVSELTHEIEMAGHWAELFFPPVQNPAATTAPGTLAPMATAMATVPLAGTDCGPGSTSWKYDTTPAIEIRDNVASGTASSFYSCLDATHVAPDTDIISIKRVAGTPTALSSSDNGSVFFRTNNSSGVLFIHPTAASDDGLSAVTPPATDWAYRVSIYYIRDYFESVGDGIPSLCREVLQGTSIVGDSAGCIPGIQNLQLEAGIDEDDDGVADFYRAAPPTNRFDNIVGVRIVVLARTAERLNGYTNPKTYTLSNLAAFAPADAFPREVMQSTVLVRNTASLQLHD